MLTTNKPNRCKHCKERMPAEFARHVLHEDCIAPWLAVQNAKKAAAQKKKALAEKKVERAVDRKRKEAVKSRPELLEDAQKAFNLFIRTRDAGLPCICCGKPFEPEKPGGSADAGHYLSRGAAPHLRFEENNCFAQRKNCNRPGGTTRQAFRAGVVARIGLEAVEALEADTAVRKWTAEDLREIRKTYAAKARTLKKESQP